jgi:hypothetical protein
MGSTSPTSCICERVSLKNAQSSDWISKYNMFYYWTHPQRKGKDICLQKDIGAPGWCKGGTYDQCPGGSCMMRLKWANLSCVKAAMSV